MNKTLVNFSLTFSFLFWGSISLADQSKTFLQDCYAGSELDSWVENKDGLTEAEQMAIYQFTLGAYRIINPALAKDELSTLTNCEQRLIRLIDSGLKKIPDEEVVVYRGTSSRHFKPDKNGILTLKGYSSTSISKEEAEAFIRYSDAGLMILTVKSGKSIAAYSNRPSEDEILLARDTKIKITEIKKVTRSLFDEMNGGFVDIEVTELYGTEILTEDSEPKTYKLEPPVQGER